MPAQHPVYKITLPKRTVFKQDGHRYKAIIRRLYEDAKGGPHDDCTVYWCLTWLPATDRKPGRLIGLTGNVDENPTFLPCLDLALPLMYHQ